MPQQGLALSPELLDCVVDEVVLMHRERPEEHTVTLHALCLVSVRLCTRLQSILFRHVVLLAPDWLSTAHIRGSHRLVSSIRHLSVLEVKDWSAIDNLLFQGRHSIESMHVDDATNSLTCSAHAQVSDYARSMSWLQQVSLILGSNALPSTDLWNPWRDHTLFNWLTGLHPGAWRSIRRFAIYGAPATHVPLLPNLKLAVIGFPAVVVCWDSAVAERLMDAAPTIERVVFVYGRPTLQPAQQARLPHALSEDAKWQWAHGHRETTFEDVRIDVSHGDFLRWWRLRVSEGGLWHLKGRNWMELDYQY